ncbi:MAG: tRNA (guanosine(46)-N7)-methyltransferase TrmB [Lachnoclostridium sp.]|nr:tRNA (guanosine(46)-N7)-methyltransferase TrmB [Lachnospira sp.]MCM1248213.1 tRNA (guanosine(46)-N7)-methyltransferase TrmB [Lachnoclostridium sp.]MCM1534999.1 tRNA (guanosine(46)-N7)-methyltransferase TrmB [Clostridium sp.]
MRLRNITGSREMIAESPYVVKEEKLESYPGHWQEIFGNGQPIHIEIGMGKGKFLYTMAKFHPDINYIGIEKYSSVLLRAIQKMEEEELPNLRFIRMDAENIDRVFGREEVDKIYLNFSDPWPKDRHAKRRLPSGQFLAKYDIILKKAGQLEFKTDNRELFDYAVEELEPAGWIADIVTYDLHGDKDLMQGNVMTEYEEKFSGQGNSICKYVIHRDKV